MTAVNARDRIPRIPGGASASSQIGSMRIAMQSEAAVSEPRVRDGRRFVSRPRASAVGWSALRYPWKFDERAGEPGVASASVARELARVS